MGGKCDKRKELSAFMLCGVFHHTRGTAGSQKAGLGFGHHLSSGVRLLVLSHPWALSQGWNSLVGSAKSQDINPGLPASCPAPKLGSRQLRRSKVPRY